MHLEQLKAGLLAVSLFSFSAFGTMAVFGAVPVIARILSDASMPQIRVLPPQNTEQAPQ
jgi:hypothetical protein